MLLPFTKMQGLGNDFVVLDNRPGTVSLTTEMARRLSDRKLGIGCDQILVLEAAKSTLSVDFTMRIWNADGGEVQHCGNGARCLAKFAYDRGIVDSNTLTIALTGGPVVATVDAEGVVSINMGEPQFEPKHIPFAADGPFVASGPFAADGSQARYRLTVGDEEIELDAVSLGNPHVVIEVDDVDAVPLERLGPAIQASPAFPQGVNVGVVKRHDRSRVVLRVFERGVGETEACGTGACAAVAVLRARQEVDEAVAVDLRGGRLHISWEGFGAPLWMTGPTSYVFEGEIEI